MTTYITLICFSLLIVVISYIFYLRIKSNLLARKCKAAFDNVYEQRSPCPKYEMEYSYGYPAFMVTFESDKELAVAKEEGLNQSFSKGIEELCKNTGSKERPFHVEVAITFTSEESLEKLRTEMKASSPQKL
jgi:hypothetical protein